MHHLAVRTGGLELRRWTRPCDGRRHQHAEILQAALHLVADEGPDLLIGRNLVAGGPISLRRSHMRMYVPKDGEYSSWQVALAGRFPLALSEMRWPSTPLGRFDTEPLARWGIGCGTGWRGLLERVLERLEAAIAAQPI